MMNLKRVTTLLLLMQLIQFSGCGKLEELTSGSDTTSTPSNGNRTTSNTPISFDKNNPQLCADYLGHYAVLKVNDRFAIEGDDENLPILSTDKFNHFAFNLIFIWDTC